MAENKHFLQVLPRLLDHPICEIRQACICAQPVLLYTGRMFQLRKPIIPLVFRQQLLRIPLTCDLFRWVSMISLPLDSGGNFDGKFWWLPGWFRLKHIWILSEPAVKILIGIWLQGNCRNPKEPVGSDQAEMTCVGFHGNHDIMCEYDQKQSF